jgi:serine/threonine protein kinase
LITRDLLLNAISAALLRHPPSALAVASVAATAGANSPPRIPGYEILKSIATSNFSTVYLARSERLKKNVVVKVLLQNQPAAAREDSERFEREYEIISSISHRAIAEIYDFGTSTDHMFLTMEYFPCGDLRDRLRNPLSADESLYYLRCIAEALRVIHAFGVLHRDLKPANVMLREDNSPVLIDFGLARRTVEDSATTALGRVLGSPYYISPEQAQALKVDPRTDLYSLGVMFFEMLTGTKPYTGKTAMAIMSQHTQAPVPTLPPELFRLQPMLERLMAKNPDQRYRAADELLADLSPAAVAAA